MITTRRANAYLAVAVAIFTCSSLLWFLKGREAGTGIQNILDHLEYHPKEASQASTLRWDDTPTSLPLASEAAESLSPTSPAVLGDKVAVMAKMKSEETEWVKELTDWETAIYHMDEPAAGLHPPQNKGREAMAYLTYIIDNYSTLPTTIAFIHSHLQGWPQAWHTDADSYSNVKSLQSLRIEYVQQHGYANLRCLQVPGCSPPEIQPFRAPFEDQSVEEPHMKDAWLIMFGANSTVPELIGAACCSQFAVSRQQVIARPLSDYIRYRQWILDTPLTDDISGRVLEYLWHIIFGKDPVHCPDVYTCHCEQFGRC